MDFDEGEDAGGLGAGAWVVACGPAAIAVAKVAGRVGEGVAAAVEGDTELDGRVSTDARAFSIDILGDVFRE